MLNNLKYSVTFASPERTLSADIDFSTGHTAIVGANGKGKSMISEMIQYCLFGSAALRGKAEDYKSLKAQLVFEVKGHRLEVERAGSKVILRDASGTLASGTKAVNAKILELFGYSYDVFTVANAANQGAIEALGNMKPSERKRMVDETVGLNVLDDLTAFVVAEIKDLNTSIKAMEEFAIAPVIPMQPAQYQPSAEVSAVLAQLHQMQQQRAVAQAAANKVIAPLPPKPNLEPDDELLEAFQKSKTLREALLVEQKVLNQQLKAIPAPVEITPLDPEDDKLAEYQAKYSEAQILSITRAELAQQCYPVDTPLTLEEIRAEEYKIRHIERWKTRLALVATRVSHDCPKCHHHWDDENPRIKAEYGDLSDERPEDSKYTSDQLRQFEKALEATERMKEIRIRLEEVQTKLAALDGPGLAQAIKRIVDARIAHQAGEKERSYAARRLELQQHLVEVGEGLRATPDQEPRITAILQARRALEVYAPLEARQKQQLAERAAALKELEQFPADLDQALVRTQALFIDCLSYETQKKAYDTALEAYLKLVALLDAKRAECESWTKAKGAITELRARVKGYLLPSLNSVASTLINQMTGGELSWIVVNEEFDITVEGQRLETLSGAGKAVANLALRIALGQVLTNRVFSVMLLDEIDASCDDDRAGYIAGCLRNLTKTIKQVVQVSHKTGLEADHFVRL